VLGRRTLRTPTIPSIDEIGLSEWNSNIIYIFVVVCIFKPCWRVFNKSLLIFKKYIEWQSSRFHLLLVATCKDQGCWEAEWAWDNISIWAHSAHLLCISKRK
jgi:hypothetical protein